jgi:hypothetical protein
MMQCKVVLFPEIGFANVDSGLWIRDSRPRISVFRVLYDLLRVGLSRLQLCMGSELGDAGMAAGNPPKRVFLGIGQAVGDGARYQLKQSVSAEVMKVVVSDTALPSSDVLVAAYVHLTVCARSLKTVRRSAQ